MAQASLWVPEVGSTGLVLPWDTLVSGSDTFPSGGISLLYTPQVV